jgi:hypothetical protein
MAIPRVSKRLIGDVLLLGALLFLGFITIPNSGFHAPGWAVMLLLLVAGASLALHYLARSEEAARKSSQLQLK